MEGILGDTLHDNLHGVVHMRLTTYHIDLFCRQLDEAVEIATQQKSEEDINFLLSKCQSNRTLVDKLQTVKAQLASKK